jgi:uncharacterized protein YjiK
MTLRSVSFFCCALLWGATEVVAQDAPTLTFEERLGAYDKSEGLTEPSGLSIGHTVPFWTVSDDHPFILGLDAKGTVVTAIPLGKGVHDLEGVIEDTARARLLVVSEKKTEITSIDLNDLSEISRYPLSEMGGFSKLLSDFDTNWKKNGLEGITVAPEPGTIYVRKEREPRRRIALSADRSTILSIEMLGRDAGLISPRKKDRKMDISGIASDPSREGQWILSDTDQAVFFRDLQDGTVYRYPLSWMSEDGLQPVSNPEGVALSADGTELFIITDNGKESALFRYDVQ